MSDSTSSSIHESKPPNASSQGLWEQEASAPVSTIEAPCAIATPQWYEGVYREAQGDTSRVHWADCKPNAAMVAWLNAEGPSLIRPGGRVVVVGSGLGDDVAELDARGFDVQGFDVSPTAVAWSRERFPSLGPRFVVADLLTPSPRMRHRFDLVVEVNTLQSLHPSAREQAAQALASLVSPRGIILTVCRGRDDAQLLESIEQPPWPLTESELTALMESIGLRPLRAPDVFMDDERPPQRRIRAAFTRI